MYRRIFSFQKKIAAIEQRENKMPSVWIDLSCRWSNIVVIVHESFSWPMEALPHMIHFTGVHAGDVTLAVHRIEPSSPSLISSPPRDT
jgi:hypothetical protein